MTEYEPTFIAQKLTPHELGGAAVMSNSLYHDTDSITALETAHAALILDCIERGTENYDTLINAAGGQVFHCPDINEAIQEVRALATEPDDYRRMQSLPPLQVAKTQQFPRPNARLGRVSNVPG